MEKKVKYYAAVLLAISFQLSAQQGLQPVYSYEKKPTDVLSGFINPPKGYGEVPFYWWQGDTLTHERKGIKSLFFRKVRTGTSRKL